MVLNKSRLFWFYITQRNYLIKGYSEHQQVKGLIEIILIASVFIKSYDIKISFAILLGLGLMALLYFWCFGFLWDRYKLFDKETEWANNRNPMLKAIKRKL